MKDISFVTFYVNLCRINIGGLGVEQKIQKKDKATEELPWSQSKKCQQVFVFDKGYIINGVCNIKAVRSGGIILLQYLLLFRTGLATAVIKH